MHYFKGHFAVQCHAEPQPMAWCGVSVTFMYCIEMDKDILILFHRLVAPPFSFFHTKFYGKILTVSSLTVCQVQVCYEKLPLLTSISLCLWNFTWWSHSYCEMPVRTRMWSIEWCHFQWPWKIYSLHFKVTIFFNDKKVENGTRELYSK